MYATTLENPALPNLHRLFEAINTGDLSVIPDAVTDDFVDHGSPDSVHIYRTEGDRLAAHWGVRDEFGVLVQVGVLAPPQVPMDASSPIG